MCILHLLLDMLQEKATEKDNQEECKVKSC